MNKFAEWMKHNDKKQLGVAKKIGVSQATMHEIIRKGHQPTLKVAYEIEKYTQGVITLYDWIDQREDESAINIKTEIETKTKKKAKEHPAKRSK